MKTNILWFHNMFYVLIIHIFWTWFCLNEQKSCRIMNTWLSIIRTTYNQLRIVTLKGLDFNIFVSGVEDSFGIQYLDNWFNVHIRLNLKSELKGGRADSYVFEIAHFNKKSLPLSSRPLKNLTTRLFKIISLSNSTIF